MSDEARVRWMGSMITSDTDGLLNPSLSTSLSLSLVVHARVPTPNEHLPTSNERVNLHPNRRDVPRVHRERVRRERRFDVSREVRPVHPGPDENTKNPIHKPRERRRLDEKRRDRVGVEPLVELAREFRDGVPGCGAMSRSGVPRRSSRRASSARAGRWGHFCFIIIIPRPRRRRRARARASAAPHRIASSGERIELKKTTVRVPANRRFGRIEDRRMHGSSRTARHTSTRASVSRRERKAFVSSRAERTTTTGRGGTVTNRFGLID